MYFPNGVWCIIKEYTFKTPQQLKYDSLIIELKQNISRAKTMFIKVMAFNQYLPKRDLIFSYILLDTVNNIYSKPYRYI